MTIDLKTGISLVGILVLIGGALSGYAVMRYQVEELRTENAEVVAKIDGLKCFIAANHGISLPECP